MLAIFKDEYAALEKVFCKVLFVELSFEAYAPAPLWFCCKAALVVELMVKTLLPLRVGDLPDVMVVTGIITAPADGYAPTPLTPLAFVYHQV